MAWRTTAALARRGHEVAVLTDARPPADLDLTGWPAVTAEDPLSSFPPDVVHGYDLALPGAVARARELAERAGARFALTPASTVDIWPDRAMGGRLCAAADVLYVLTRTEADAVCALGAEPARLRELPAAPDLVGSPRPAAFRTRYGVSGPLVLFLGRRVATKGYRTLLDAAPAAWAAFPDTVFAFAGPLGEPAAAKPFPALTDRRIPDPGG